ncbi:MAG TPA: hypothetical protein VK694_04775 [Verrucomicrobiae bacterium]|nr:hypothetical protein [Verrucomicrobiae bacterium]
MEIPGKLLAFGAAATLSLAACGGEPGTPTTPESTVSDPDAAYPVTHTYYKNQRVTEIGDAENVDHSTVVAYCEGPDLVEASLGFREPSEIRSVGHTACVDHVLSASDFDDSSSTDTTVG